MEMSFVNKDNIAVKPEWIKKLRIKVKELENTKSDKIIRVDLKRGENPSGLETAWRKLCSKELKNTPHVHILKHQLGATVWLWWS